MKTVMGPVALNPPRAPTKSRKSTLIKSLPGRQDSSAGALAAYKRFDARNRAGCISVGESPLVLAPSSLYLPRKSECLSELVTRAFLCFT